MHTRTDFISIKHFSWHVSIYFTVFAHIYWVIVQTTRERRGRGECGNAHSCCLLLNGDFINLKLERESMEDGEREMQKREKSALKKSDESRREESTRCPICTRQSSLCNCNGHTRKVSNGQQQQQQPTQDVIQFHI